MCASSDASRSYILHVRKIIECSVVKLLEREWESTLRIDLVLRVRFIQISMINWKLITWNVSNLIIINSKWIDAIQSNLARRRELFNFTTFHYVLNITNAKWIHTKFKKNISNVHIDQVNFSNFSIKSRHLLNI